VPSLLSLTKKLNAEKHLGLSRVEVSRAAQAMEKRCEGWLQVDAEAYCLHFWDETGELAVRNVQKERNAANAARRCAA
jgi:NTP pyrophosphatase (non-canonical NTP hydrolase)